MTRDVAARDDDTHRRVALVDSCRPARRLVLAASTLAFVVSCSRMNDEQRAYVETLMKHRTQIDTFMTSEQSPLTDEQRGRFKGLAFYPARFDLILDVQLERASQPDTVRFLTSQGTYDSYVRLGALHFDVRQGMHELTLFQAVDGGTLFLPFTDQTSGDETYGAGRYLNPEPLGGDRYRLDFNLAYNPYCAYNAGWICPLPPPENRLGFRVDAGERNFPYK